MLQDMDHMEASCGSYVKVSMFDQLEQHKIWVSTNTLSGIVILTLHCEVMLIFGSGSNGVDIMRRTLPHILSAPECLAFFYQHVISAIIHHNGYRERNKKHQTD